VGIPQFSQGLSPDSGQAVHAPPYIDPPRGAVWVDRTFDPQTGIDGGGASRIAFPVPFGNDLEVPAGWEYRLWRIGFGSIDPADLVYTTFKIMKDGNPLQGFENNPVALGTLDQPGDVFLHLAGPATLSIAVFNGFPFIGQKIRVWIRVVGWLFKSGA
jgi:hypothetical protein